MENSANSKVVQRYVDILTNPGFKAVFGDVANKDAVMMIIICVPFYAKVARINPGYNMHFFRGLRDNFIKLTRCSSPEA